MRMPYPLLVLVAGILLFLPADALAIPVPVVTTNVPDDVLIGEPFTFTVTLDNTDTVDTGYGPFIDIVLPRRGADGTTNGGTVDGISFISASYLGLTLSVEELVFPSGGCVDHPLLVGTDLLPVEVCGTPGDVLVVVQLPLAAITPDQPPAVLNVTAQMSDLADANESLTVRTRGGFTRGSTAEDDPCCDPFLVTGFDSFPITPRVMEISKVNNAQEGEVAGGSSYSYQYTITVDVAAGETVTNLEVTDFMPDNLQFVQIISVVDSTGTALAFTDNGPTAAGDDLVVTVASVTGTASANDVVITFEFIAPFSDAGGNDVLDGTTGAGFFTQNTSAASGDWTPADPRDGATVGNAQADGTCPTCPGNNAPFIASIAVQKVYAITTDNNFPGESPLDVITYTMDYQIADSFAFGTVVINDILSDGQTFVAGSAVLTFDRLGTTTTVNPIVPAEATNADGSTLLVFDISGALAGAGQADNGNVLGACVPTGGAGGNSLDCGATNPTQGTLTYRATINQEFASTTGTNINVDQGDLLTNEAEIEGVLLAPSDLTPNPTITATNVTDVEFNIVNVDPTKELYAINGVLCAVANCADQFIFPLDEVTYRVQQTVPTRDFETLQLVDFLPQRVYDASEITTFDSSAASADIPPAGTARYGPNDTTDGNIGPPAITSENTINNTVTFDYGSNSDDTNTNVNIDILFTATVLNAPYPSDQLLGNIIETQENTTNDGLNASAALAALPLQRPILRTTKGAVASSSSTVAYEPPTVGPATFNPPGSNPSFTGIINSDALEANAIDSDVNGVQVGDVVTFAFVVENVGDATYGVFDITLRDDIPAGFGIPATGSNLQVRLGNGTGLTYINLGDGVEDLFDDGIELNDFDQLTGVCTPFNATSGANIVVVTYDLVLVAQQPDTVTNTGVVTNYAARDNGANYLAAGAVSGTADVIFGSSSDDDDDDGGDITATEQAALLTTAQLQATATTRANITATQEAFLASVGTLPATGQSPWSAVRQRLIVTMWMLLAAGVITVWAVVLRE
ncbi:MAG: hypothetical protein AAF787_05065 [Chloroflexota bacterium]